MLTSYDKECFNRAKELIRKDLSKHYSITDIARQVNISPSKLKTGFKKVFGLGLYEYLRRERMEKGKYLLENSEKTLKEISSKVGFKYENNFCAAFKKRFKVSPAEWRNSHTSIE